MVRPRTEPIELTNEDAALSRRRLLALAGAAGLSLTAGCGGSSGGGGGGASPTATYGDRTVTDVTIHQALARNLEKFTPNAWHPLSGYLPQWQRLPLATVPSTRVAPPGDPSPVVLPGAATSVTLDPGAGVATFELHPDIEWADGTAFDAESAKMHWDLVEAAATIRGGGAEFPAETAVEGENTLRVTLGSGNPLLRLYETVLRGRMPAVTMTHPSHHGEYVESVRDASTQAETKAAIQKLWNTRLPQDVLPDLALGPFVPTNVSPQQLNFSPRGAFPWGLGQREVTRLFGEVKAKSIVSKQVMRGREIGISRQQQINAAIAGDQDFITLNIKGQYERFPDDWKHYRMTEAAGATLYFSPGSKWGERSARARKLRKAVAYLADPGTIAAVNDLAPAYEKTAGFVRQSDFERWLGDAFEGFTNYGTGMDESYAGTEKGYALLREAGFERNASGNWIDAGTGEPLKPKIIYETASNLGLTKAVLGEVGTQLNEHGIQGKNTILGAELFEKRIKEPSKFQMAIMTGQATVSPHPYFAFRDDLGLGSRELGASFSPSNWRNGYAQVEVPMPVGDPDGGMTTYDWDAKVKAIATMDDHGAIAERIRELSWVLNQWVPGVHLVAQTRHAVLNTARFDPTSDWSAALWPPAGVDIARLVALGYLEPA